MALPFGRTIRRKNAAASGGGSANAFVTAVQTNMTVQGIWVPPVGVTNGQNVVNSEDCLVDISSAGAAAIRAVLASTGDFTYVTSSPPSANFVASVKQVDKPNAYAAIVSALGSGAACGGVIFKCYNLTDEACLFTPFGTLGSPLDKSDGNNTGQCFLSDDSWEGHSSPPHVTAFPRSSTSGQSYCNPGWGSTPVWVHLQWRQVSSTDMRTAVSKVGQTFKGLMDNTGGSSNTLGTGAQIGLGGGHGAVTTEWACIYIGSDVGLAETALSNIHSAV